MANEETLMEPEDLRAEIQRKRQRANDLRIREVLWGLYYGRLSQYTKMIEKDPARVYPDLKADFNTSVLARTQLFPKGTLIQFAIGPTSYQMLYREGPEEVRDGSGIGFSRCSVTPASILLRVDAVDVFEFNIRRSVRDEEWGPIFDNSMGEINRFIEGSWVSELAELLMRIKEHEKRVWDQRDTPRLEAMKKRFGL